VQAILAASLFTVGAYTVFKNPCTRFGRASRMIITYNSMLMTSRGW